MNQVLANIEAQESELANQLESLKREREQAKQRAIDELKDQVVLHYQQAEAFRIQAEKSNSDSEKQRLYIYAQEQEDLAVTIRKQLGENIEQQPTKKLTPSIDVAVARKVNGFAIRGLVSFLLYLIIDFIAGQIDVGFGSFALTMISQFLWFFASTFAVYFLSFSAISGIMQSYLPDLVKDWKRASVNTRLLVAVILIVGLLIALVNNLPHGK
jgi:Fe2+ transport system protein B